MTTKRNDCSPGTGRELPRVEAMDGPALARARALLGKSQRELAAILGLSLKAVESYEQGWRKVPETVERQLYFLALKLRGPSPRASPPCWELRGCSGDARAACMAWLAKEGEFCWFLTGRTCASAAEAERAGGGERFCFGCPAFLSLLEGAGMPRGFSA